MNESTRMGGLTLATRVLSARTAVLQLAGRLNAVTVPALRARVDEIVRQGRPEIVCDLAGVTFLDSSGLAALIVAVESTTSKAGFFKIAAASDAARRLFRLTHIDGLLELHPSIESILGEDAPEPAMQRAA